VAPPPQPAPRTGPAPAEPPPPAPPLPQSLDFILGRYQVAPAANACPKGMGEVCYTPLGLAQFSPWGNLRYVANVASLAAMYADLLPDDAAQRRHRCWARGQVQHMVGRAALPPAASCSGGPCTARRGRGEGGGPWGQRYWAALPLLHAHAGWLAVRRRRLAAWLAGRLAPASAPAQPVPCAMCLAQVGSRGGRSYVAGYGPRYPRRLHHRSASCDPNFDVACGWTRSGRAPSGGTCHLLGPAWWRLVLCCTGAGAAAAGRLLPCPSPSPPPHLLQLREGLGQPQRAVGRTDRCGGAGPAARLLARSLHASLRGAPAHFPPAAAQAGPTRAISLTTGSPTTSATSPPSTTTQVRGALGLRGVAAWPR
jgi:hypothetical protein